MNDSEILNIIQAIFRDVLENDSLVLLPELANDDITGWDSLRNALIMAEVQKKFGMKLSISELVKVENIRDIIELVKAKSA